MSIRSKKEITSSGSATSSSGSATITETSSEAPAAVAEVKAAAKLNAKPKAEEEVLYELITPYPIVTPGGVRFLPNEPKLHKPTNWLQSNVEAKLFRIIKQ